MKIFHKKIFNCTPLARTKRSIVFAHVPVNLFFIAFAFAGAGAICRARAEEQPLAPSLIAEPNAEGSITWWLISPGQKGSFDKVAPPRAARENAALGGGDTGEKWSLYISQYAYADFSSYVNASTGFIWATAFIDSATGGKRHLHGTTFGALRIFQDGKLVMDKPQPNGRDADSDDREIELPKGVCELSVAASSRSGQCAFYLCLTDAPSAPNGAVVARPHAVPGDRIVIPAAAGQEPDKGAAALRALTCGAGAKDRFIAAGESVPVLAGMQGSIPMGLGHISVRFVGPDGKQLGNDMPARTGAELKGTAFSAEYKSLDDKELQRDVTVEVSADGKLLGIKKIPLYSLKALPPALDAMENEIEQRAAKAGHAMPNAALAIEKAKLLLRKQGLTRDIAGLLQDWLYAGRAYADAEEQGKDPCENKSGYFERAYQSRIDDSAQPYFIQVPSVFSDRDATQRKNAGVKYPLIVFLHGYVPSYDKDRWWDEFAEFNVVFERFGAFLVIPFARSNTDFQGCGEVDVMDAIAEAKRLYPIDDERVYLYGYSMGGQGVYTIGAHYPDMFAAGIVLAGRADSPLQNHKPLEGFLPYKQWLIQSDNPISLCENFLNVPLRIYHGLDDPIINVDEARRMEKRLIETGCDAKLTAMPGTHKFGLNVMMSDEPVQWLLQQKRKTFPERRRMKTFNLRYAQQGRVVATGMPPGLEPLDLEWSIKGQKQEFLHKNAPFVEIGLSAPKLEKPPEQARPPVKSVNCCGPIRNATCGPFLLVYGTSGSAEANARNKKNAGRFADDWYAYGKSRVRVKADNEVTESDKKGKNLFLFGEQQENLLHAAASKDLPFVVKDGQASIGEKKFALAGHGIMYIYPSPFSTEARTVVICAGIPHGRELDTNHKLDLLPDFVYYDDHSDKDSTGTNHAICAGFFDGEWKLDPKLTWWFEGN